MSLEQKISEFSSMLENRSLTANAEISAAKSRESYNYYTGIAETYERVFELFKQHFELKAE